MTVVGEKRSTWSRWNLHAEASRQLKGVRFVSTRDREAVTALVAGAAEQASVRLTPPELAAVPVEFQRTDGSSVFRPRHSTVYSSSEQLAAEDRLLERARRRTAPVVASNTVVRVLRSRRGHGPKVGVDQAAAVTAVVSSGRLLDVLVGPAGSGKTRTMALLRRVWELEHGRSSVVGLAPSAGAADVLAGELGIQAENTAKWLHDFRAGAAAFRAGQLVIIDEASLAGTRTLDAITHHAEAAGAKVLLVGDWAQLQAVEAGGRSRSSSTTGTTHPNSPTSTGSHTPGRPTPHWTYATAGPTSSTPTWPTDAFRAARPSTSSTPRIAPGGLTSPRDEAACWSHPPATRSPRSTNALERTGSSPTSSIRDERSSWRTRRERQSATR